MDLALQEVDFQKDISAGVLVLVVGSLLPVDSELDWNSIDRSWANAERVAGNNVELRVTSNGYVQVQAIARTRPTAQLNQLASFESAARFRRSQSLEDQK